MIIASSEMMFRQRSTRVAKPWLSIAIPCLLLIAATFLLYLRTAWFGIVDFDDAAFIWSDPYVLGGLSPQGISGAFTTGGQGNWVPLTRMSWMLDVSLWGTAPGPLHLINALLHAVNTGLLYCLLHLLTGARGRSFAVALLFGVHPLHVESVAWISERRDVLFLFWTLVALLLYRSYALKASKVRFAAVTCGIVLALLSKSMSVTVPLLMLCLDFWPLQRWKSGTDDERPFQMSKWVPLVVEKLPWLVLSLLTGIITVAMQGGEGAIDLNSRITLLSRCMNALDGLAWYIEKTFWPTQLCIMYEHPFNNWDPAQVAVSGVIVLLVSLWVFRNFRRQPYLLTGWSWYLISLLPVIGLLQVGAQAHADRYSYLPQIGLGLMIVWQVNDWLEKISRPRTVQVILTTVVALIFAGLTVRQIEAWQGPESLWRHALDVKPDSPLANCKVGEWELRSENWAAAEKHFQLAVELNPLFRDAWLQLANANERQGKVDEAAQSYLEALKLDSSSFLALKNLGRIYQQQGKLDLAQKVLNEAVQVNQFDPDIRNRLGILYGSRGDIQTALKMFEEAVRVAPADPVSRINLGMALNHLQRFDESLPHLQKAVELDSENAAAHANLAIAWEQLGQIQEAINEYTAALRVNPDDAVSRQRLEALKMTR